MKTIVTFAIVAAVTLPAGVAVADNLEEAKAAFATGKAAFERGDWDTALAQFQRANQLAPAPSLSYNIGKTYEKMGRYHDAAASFQKYLELVGPPQNDDDKRLQDDLRQKIAQDAQLPDGPRQPAGGVTVPPPPPSEARTPPPPGYPPPQPYPNYYQPPPPYYANPYGYAYQAPPLTRQQRLDRARHRRNGGIGTFVAGGVLTVLGVSLIGGGCGVTAGCNNFDVNDPSVNAVSGAVMLGFGVPSLIVGVILLPVGAVNWARGQAEMNHIQREPMVPAPPTAEVPGQPSAFLFSLPPLRF